MSTTQSIYDLGICISNCKNKLKTKSFLLPCCNNYICIFRKDVSEGRGEVNMRLFLLKPKKLAYTEDHRFTLQDTVCIQESMQAIMAT